MSASMSVSYAQEQREQTLEGEAELLEAFQGKIVFQSDRSGSWEIYTMNADGSHLVQLTHNTFFDEYPVWSPDGRKVAFKSNRDGNYEIYVMNADGTKQTRLTDHQANDEDPAWSPDGDKIAFHSDRKGGKEIYIMDADGSNVRRMTKTLGKNVLSAWSPDGASLAYTGNRYLGWGVYIMNLDGSSDKRVIGEGACRPDWSPDGKRIAYVTEKGTKKADIWVMNADGSDRQKLTPDEKNYDYFPAWSPDGKYIIYAKSPDKEKGNWELYIMSSDGKKHVRLTDHPSQDKFPDWHSSQDPKK